MNKKTFVLLIGSGQLAIETIKSIRNLDGFTLIPQIFTYNLTVDEPVECNWHKDIELTKWLKIATESILERNPNVIIIDLSEPEAALTHLPILLEAKIPILTNTNTATHISAKNLARRATQPIFLWQNRATLPEIWLNNLLTLSATCIGDCFADWSVEIFTAYQDNPLISTIEQAVCEMLRVAPGSDRVMIRGSSKNTTDSVDGNYYSIHLKSPQGALIELKLTFDDIETLCHTLTRALNFINIVEYPGAYSLDDLLGHTLSNDELDENENSNR